MPELIGVGEFLEETREDYNSPTTSTFVSRMAQCRQTIATLEETLDFDREGLTKLKRQLRPYIIQETLMWIMRCVWSEHWNVLVR